MLNDLQEHDNHHDYTPCQGQQQMSGQAPDGWYGQKHMPADTPSTQAFKGVHAKSLGCWLTQPSPSPQTHMALLLFAHAAQRWEEATDVMRSRARGWLFPLCDNCDRHVAQQHLRGDRGGPMRTPSLRCSTKTPQRQKGGS